MWNPFYTIFQFHLVCCFLSVNRLLRQAPLRRNDAEGPCRCWDWWWEQKRIQNLPSPKESTTAAATLVLEIARKQHFRKAKPKTSGRDKPFPCSGRLQPEATRSQTLAATGKRGAHLQSWAPGLRTWSRTPCQGTGQLVWHVTDNAQSLLITRKYV